MKKLLNLIRVMIVDIKLYQAYEWLFSGFPITKNTPLMHLFSFFGPLSSWSLFCLSLRHFYCWFCDRSEKKVLNVQKGDKYQAYNEYFSKQIKIKSSLYQPKRVTSWRSRSQRHCARATQAVPFKKMSLWWRVVGNTVSDLTDRDLNLRPLAPETKAW